MSQTKFHHNWITKSKLIHVQIPVTKWEKAKTRENFSGLQYGEMRGLQIGAGFRGYKSGQEELQTGVALGISNQGKEIPNPDKDFKSRENTTSQICFTRNYCVICGKEMRL